MLSKNVIVLPEFATSTLVFSEVIGTSVTALKKMSSLEVMLCRSKNAEKKRKSELTHYIHVTTSITTMEIKVKCILTNHIY